MEDELLDSALGEIEAMNSAIDVTEIDIESEPQEKRENETSDGSPYQPKQPKLINLPLARVKQIIKMDPEVTITSADAVFLITKATELFIETLGKDSYGYTMRAKKKTIQKKDVDSAVASTDALIFLDGAFGFKCC